MSKLKKLVGVTLACQLFIDKPIAISQHKPCACIRRMKSVDVLSVGAEAADSGEGRMRIYYVHKIVYMPISTYTYRYYVI
jgi:hypothetical protein